jgi:flagellar basal-body rod modification protein FlgD
MTAADTSTAATSGSGKGIDSLNSADFLNLLVAELGNQDPFQPMTNQDLMNEVGSIRNLQMNDTLNQSLQNLTMQDNMAAASNMIGQTVVGTVAAAGANSTATTVTGIVTGVQISNSQVQLALDNGTLLSMSNVTQVGSVPTATDGSTTGQTG